MSAHCVRHVGFERVVIFKAHVDDEEESAGGVEREVERLDQLVLQHAAGGRGDDG